MCVVSSLTERPQDRIYNAVVVFSNKGDIILTHRKINELSFCPRCIHNWR